MLKKEVGFREKLLLTYLPMAGTVLMVVSYSPQLYLTYTTQNVSGQSLSFWVLLVLALASMVGQQVGMIKFRSVRSYTGLIFQVLNLILATAMLVGVIIFN